MGMPCSMTNPNSDAQIKSWPRTDIRIVNTLLDTDWYKAWVFMLLHYFWTIKSTLFLPSIFLVFYKGLLNRSQTGPVCDGRPEYFSQYQLNVWLCFQFNQITVLKFLKPWSFPYEKANMTITIKVSTAVRALSIVTWTNLYHGCQREAT